MLKEGKPVKAILIDPVERKVNYVDISTSDDIARIIRDHITIATAYPNGDCVYVADNGLAGMEDAMHGKDEAFRAYAFDLQTGETLAGYGLVCGEDDEGDLADVKTTVEFIRARVTFYVPRAAAADGPRH
jgi:hypothetical protein